MKYVPALLLLAAFASNALAAGEVIGWRGDSTGIYPKTDPPLHWRQQSPAVEALRYQTQPPKGDTPPDASAHPMPDGVIREWLILGPISSTKTDKDSTDELFAVDQSKLAPAIGQKVGDAEWKILPVDSDYLDFAKLFGTYGKPTAHAAYAFTYLYSPADAPMVVSYNHTGSGQLWFNGKITPRPEGNDLNYVPIVVTLKKGWNTFLMRDTPSTAGRPENGTWYMNFELRSAADKIPYNTQGIAWKTQLPALESFGPPILVKDKIFLLSEIADIVCLDAKTGKILWLRSNNYDELATDEEKKANPEVFQEIAPLQQKLQQINADVVAGKMPEPQALDGALRFKDKTDTQNKLISLMKKVDDKKYGLPKGQDVNYAGFSPVSDGKYVYAWFATGVTCCYDLEGKLIWRRLDNEGSFFEHGYSVSPFLADGKLVVYMNNLIAFDAATGKRLWTTNFSGIAQTRFHGTPAPFKIADTAYCVIPTGHIIRLSDGKIVRDKGPEISGRQQEIPSPVVMVGSGNTLYELSTFTFFNKVVLPSQPADPLPADVKSVTLDVSKFPVFYLDWFLSSPLIDNDLAYCINNSGVLCVVDTDTMQIVYQQLLDIDAYQNGHDGAGRGLGISPSLAGGRIYLVSNTGTTIVLKPGRTYEQLAKNKIESAYPRYWSTRTERFVAAPIFDGKHMILRGERYLYCFSE